MKLGSTTARLIFLAIALLSGKALALTPLDYPQPQFIRHEWQNLNGPWDFSFDDENHGLKQNWQSLGIPTPRPIQVPFAFQSSLSGIGDRTKHAVSWYRKSFSTPKSWQGREVLLHFGAVYYKATVWLNGEKIGEHIGGQTPFKFKISDQINRLSKNGMNELVVRCEHPQSNKFIARGKQTYENDSVGNYYTRTSGIWQSVWLEATGASFLENVQFANSISGESSARLKINSTISVETVRLTIELPNGKSQIIEQKTASAGTDVTVPFTIQNPQLWDTTHPNLYDVKIELVDSKNRELDTVFTYFGIREVGTKNGHVTINGNSLYLKFVLDQGFWPEGIWTPPSTEAMQKDLDVTKALGFNGLRMHQKLEDPRFLYLADRMGLLVSGEFANPISFSESGSNQFTAEWREAVERDWNHPSIIMWAPTNESWGFPKLTDKNQHEAMIANFKMTKNLDSSRIVIDNEGGPHTAYSDVFTVHDYATSGKGMLKELAKLNPKPTARRPKPVIDYSDWTIDGLLFKGGVPMYLSEFGGVRFVLPGDQLPPVGEWESDDLLLNGEQALNRIKDLYSAISFMPNITGICLTQLMDVESETNGMMTYHRVMKFDPTEIKKLNDSLK